MIAPATNYTNFFIASSGASAALIGLLFVAISIAGSNELDQSLREKRTVLAMSAFLALIDGFFVSLVSLTGGNSVFAMVSLVMAVIGLLGTIRFLPHAKKTGIFAKEFSSRKINIVSVVIALTLYVLQFWLALALLHSVNNALLTNLLTLIMVGLFGSALRRAWEISGIRKR